jgi:hypothetical protein
MEAKLHAVLSPSGAHRWMNCIGAPAMEMGLPDGSNEYSDEGTCAHNVAAMCFKEKRPATAYIGRYVDVGPCRAYEFREDMAEAVQCYVDMVDSLPGEKFYEVAVPIGHLTGEEGATGTADVVSMTDDFEEIIVVDLKFGMGVFVNVERNKQAMTYALGALKKYDVLGSIKRVRMFIHQPRISEAPSEWDCTVEELLAFAAEVEDKAAQARLAITLRDAWMHEPDTGGYLTPGDEQCKFCKAKATCPALAKFVQENVGADFEVLATPNSIDIPIRLASLDAPVLAMRLTATGLIEDWIKAVRAEAERKLLAGETVPGYKIVQGRQGNRKWSDPDAVEKMMKETFRLTNEQMYDFKLISPTTAEKLAPKLDKDGKVKPMKEGAPEPVIGVRQWPKLATLITRAEGAMSVAPESDPRPAITVNPLADHEALDASDLA